MSEQNEELEVIVTPMVQVLVGGETFNAPFSELLTENDTADPATISDSDLKARLVETFGLQASDINDHVVTRPETGNILVSPKPVYG